MLSPFILIKFLHYFNILNVFVKLFQIYANHTSKYGEQADSIILCANILVPSADTKVTSAKLSLGNSVDRKDTMLGWWLFHRKQYSRECELPFPLPPSMAKNFINKSPDNPSSKRDK